MEVCIGLVWHSFITQDNAADDETCLTSMALNLNAHNEPITIENFNFFIHLITRYKSVHGLNCLRWAFYLIMRIESTCQSGLVQVPLSLPRWIAVFWLNLYSSCIAAAVINVCCKLTRADFIEYHSEDTHQASCLPSPRYFVTTPRSSCT